MVGNVYLNFALILFIDILVEEKSSSFFGDGYKWLKYGRKNKLYKRSL